MYVERKNGVIVGAYAVAQQGYAEEEVADNSAELLEFLNPPASTAYTIAKSTPWIRMTGDEAELITGAMQQADARLKGIYDASTFLNSADPLWTTLHDMIATTLNSSTRADELLAPET